MTRESPTEATRQKRQGEDSKLLSPENSAHLKENVSKLGKVEVSLVRPGFSPLCLFAPVQIPSPLFLHHDRDVPTREQLRGGRNPCVTKSGGPV